MFVPISIGDLVTERPPESHRGVTMFNADGSEIKGWQPKIEHSRSMYIVTEVHNVGWTWDDVGIDEPPEEPFYDYDAANRDKYTLKELEMIEDAIDEEKWSGELAGYAGLKVKEVITGKLSYLRLNKTQRVR